MALRVYVAAPWVRKADAIAAGKVLEANGFEVTSRWFHHEGDPQDFAGTKSSLDSIRQQAFEDLQDVQRAEVLIVLNLEKSEGKAVETGYALALGNSIISVGPRSNIFQTLGTEVATLSDAIIALRGIEQYV